jgi:nucleotide-binding universal stress UspA family protein
MTINPAQDFLAKPTITAYKKILVAVDYLASTPEIFSQALNLAQANQAELMIFHCIQGDIPGMPEMVAYAGMGAYSGIYSQEMVDYETHLLQEATAELCSWLASFVKLAEEKGIKADSDYATGQPGQQICQLAKSWGADLIIVGRRGRTGLSELLLGSVSNYVIHHAHCCLLVVQHC